MKSVCVYCGSSSGAGTAYLAMARELAKEIARRNIRLIYGGASIGLMGEVADTVMSEGGKVTGVLPRNLFRQEVPHNGLTELIEVDSMHERKALMVELADGFIALPGGMGTIEELFEVLTWAQLSLHNKPCGVLNVEGYYDHLSRFLDHGAEQKFIRPAHRNMLITAEDPAVLLDKFLSYKAPSKQKWVDLEDK